MASVEGNPVITRRELMAVAASAAPLLHAADLPQWKTVKGRRWAREGWTDFPTRTIDQLAGFRPSSSPPKLGRYGGLIEKGRRKGDGFFRVRQENGRWWLIDPDGYRSIQPALASTQPGASERAQTALREKFGDREKWAVAATKMLRDSGFTGLGAWSDVKSLTAIPDRLPWYTTLSFMGTFGKAKKLTVRQPGHVGFVKDAMPVFHPEFEPFCDDYAKQLAATKDDPYLVGHFSDNETPAPVDMLLRYLGLDPADVNRQGTVAWLAKRKGTTADVSTADLTDADKEAFREYIYERYLETTAKAIRKYDPNHMCFGPRLWGPSIRSEGILRACGRHLEAIAVNIYHQWEPEPKLVDMWRRESGKPWLVTEFYAKGEDSGLPNTTGAGWLVQTQADRAKFYQHFTLALLESRDCIGWQWLTYQDNDPENKKAELSNLDANKGIVDIRYEPYQPLVEGMKLLNTNVFALAAWFDRKHT